MKTFYRILFSLLLIVSSLPLGYANSVSAETPLEESTLVTKDKSINTSSENNWSPPPVEKVKPKVKKKKKRHRKFRKKKKPEQTQINAGGGLLLGLAILGLLVFLVGVVLVSIGFAPIGIGVGLVIGGGFLCFLLLNIIMGDTFAGGALFDMDISYGEGIFVIIFFWVVAIAALIIGIAFLISGLSMGLPFLWILGLCLLLVALVLIALHFLYAMM